MKKLFKILTLFLLTTLLSSCAFLGQFPIDPPLPNEETPVENTPIEETFEDYGFPILDIYISKHKVEKGGIYNTKEEVAIYIFLFDSLPSNYRSSSSEVKKGYTSENKLSYTGGTFYNREGLLPKASSRSYIECDIDYTGGSRNAKRIVYSNDGLIFYTDTHYSSFYIIRIHKNVN